MMNDPFSRARIPLARARAKLGIVIGQAGRFANRTTTDLWQFAQPKILISEPARVESSLLKTLAQLVQVQMREEFLAFARQVLVSRFTPRVEMGRLYFEENWNHAFTARSVIH